MAAYRIFKAVGTSTTFAQVATTTSLSFNDTAVPSGSSYSYRVFAVDGVGNVSAQGNTATITVGSTSTTSGGGGGGGGGGNPHH